MALRTAEIDRRILNRGTQERWSSIFTGTVVTIALGLFFILLGNAVGLSIYNVVSPEAHGGLSFWSWVYNLPTLVLAYGAGAFLSARADGYEGGFNGALNGVISWAAVSTITTFFLLIGTSSGRAILQGTGVNGGNWFSLFVLALGFLSSSVGGILGAASVDSYSVTDRSSANIRAAS